MKILSLDNISIEKEGKPLIDGLSLQIYAGERLLIMSQEEKLEALIRLLQGKETYQSGAYEFMGREVLGLSNIDLARLRKLQVIYLQFRDINNHEFTVDGLLQQPLKYSGLYPSKWKKSITEVCSLLELKEIKKRVMELAPIEEFRAYIAKGIVVRPKLLIIKDPFFYYPDADPVEIVATLDKLKFMGIAVSILSSSNVWKDKVCKYFTVDGY